MLGMLGKDIVQLKEASPHGFHIWVVLATEELVAAVSPHHVFVNRELHVTPELFVLIRSHRKPEN